ncbi:MAG TPA: hypothetical protein GXZ60_05810 [Intrasporangiaceae bacterium]|nr:hypothetical protein [Intrasporangiaceae bacterium]
MGILTTIRIEDFVQRYDFWLELRGARRRRRKELRRELRANLQAAAADIGASSALLNVGTPKQLAFDATEGEYERRPLWSRAALFAALTFGAMLFALMYTATTFAAGVEAAGVVGQEATGSVFPWPGTVFKARIHPDRGGLAVGASHPWPVLVVPLLVFLLTARPWRLLTRQGASTRTGEPVH